MPQPMNAIYAPWPVTTTPLLYPLKTVFQTIWGNESMTSMLALSSLTVAMALAPSQALMQPTNQLVIIDLFNNHCKKAMLLPLDGTFRINRTLQTTIWTIKVHCFGT